MKRTLLVTLPLVLAIVGCTPDQVKQAAEASDNAASALLAAQQVETAAHTSGLISNSEDLFIQTQFKSLAIVGTNTDTCIRSATSSGGAIACLNTAINGVDQINSSGGLELKSATAKADFEMGISAVRTVLAAIETSIGGTPPAVPTGAAQ